MESLKFVKGFSRIRKVRAFFIQGRDLKRATDFERSKSGLFRYLRSTKSYLFKNLICYLSKV